MTRRASYADSISGLGTTVASRRTHTAGDWRWNSSVGLRNFTRTEPRAPASTGHMLCAVVPMAECSLETRGVDDGRDWYFGGEQCGVLCSVISGSIPTCQPSIWGLQSQPQLALDTGTSGRRVPRAPRHVSAPRCRVAVPSSLRVPVGTRSSPLTVSFTHLHRQLAGTGLQRDAKSCQAPLSLFLAG